MIDKIPPTGLVLLAIVAVQVGSSLATHMFPLLGAEGTVAVRLIFSAIFLLILARQRVRKFGQLFLDNWPMLLVFGICMSVMNFFFYQAISRIPLGAAVAFEFIGPLGVSAITSRRMSHFFWVLIAVVGILLLSPLSGNDLNTLGIVYALLAGGGWACFVLLAGKIGQRVPGNDGLSIAMVVAAVTMIPFAVPVAGTLVANPLLLLAGAGIALLSTTIPLSLEFLALRQMSARTYGILVSLEPGLAVLAGAILLGERIGIKGVLAVACVVIAAIGITLSDRAEQDAE